MPVEIEVKQYFIEMFIPSHTLCMQTVKLNTHLRLHKQAPSESSLLTEIALFALQISDVRGGLKSGFFFNRKELYLKRMRPKLKNYMYRTQ